MSKVKRILAVVLAMAMVMAMSVVSFAADSVPKDGDQLEVTIANVDNASLKVVQIIEAKYSTYGLEYYQWTTASGKEGQVKFKNDEVEGLTSEYITNLARTAEGNAFINGGYLKPGTYMVIATSNDPSVVYNPMVVSVYYTKDGLQAAPLTDTNWELETTDAYAKKSSQSFDKEVTGAAHGTENLTDSKDVQVGDKVSFKITGTIPSYSAQFTKPVYKISDTLTKGLEKYENIVVKVGGVPLTESETTYSLTDITDESKTFTVEFVSSYISGLADKTEEARSVEITYDATVTAEATSTVPATNEATITYSHTPDEEKTDTKTTKTYTFELDNNFTKVDENKTALPNAEFTLYRHYTNGTLTEEVAKKTSDENGNIVFTGLDATTYYLKETAAPNGYQLNDTVYTVEIKAEYDENGVPTKTVSITDPSNTDSAASDHVEIQNTHLSALPSTGGAGIIVFTIVGCIIMIAAASMFFLSGRKKEE